MMSKGRNTTCITIRVTDSTLAFLKDGALRYGYASVGLFIKACIPSFMHDRSIIEHNVITTAFRDEILAQGNISKSFLGMSSDEPGVVRARGGSPKTALSAEQIREAQARLLGITPSEVDEARDAIVTADEVAEAVDNLLKPLQQAVAKKVDADIISSIDTDKLRVTQPLHSEYIIGVDSAVPGSDHTVVTTNPITVKTRQLGKAYPQRIGGADA